MALFKPGEKARIARWHDVKKRFRGLECTMVTGLVSSPHFRELGYRVEIPGHPTPNGWFGTPDCFEKIQPERNTKVAWKDIPFWSPDKLKENTDAPAVPVVGDPVHGLLV